MKVFIIGLPKSGKTTVSTSICASHNFPYLDYDKSLVKFRDPFPSEKESQYAENHTQFFLENLKNNPNQYLDQFINYSKFNNLVVDGVSSPRDFVHLFDYNSDIVVFLNRTDTESFKDFENVSVSVIKDYCYWLSSSGLLAKNKWLEYNFKIPGIESDSTIKKLGNKNTVFIAKSIGNVINHLKDYLSQ